ncbi:MAG: 4-(cytidine 5'-diphospho)-2-C-methyl-D-erythritol kinase [Gammaproteobacteria bacterium]|nr:4-(cytidine 5'-diphospho)-2-C-methyl-D-erythritol kinase [Gammaproteobacteria bacterium]
MRLYAPAKLNLFLHVTDRREDGYHDLQTLFQLIDYTDCLTIESREDGRFEYADDVDVDFGGSNLCLRAAELARERHPGGCGASIFLNKKIAVGAGLGGGSSDAAAVLHGLNRLWGRPWSIEELAAMGLELGADVPLFVYGRTAWAEGVGEKLTPVDRPEGFALVLPTPSMVSTAEVYQSLQLTQWSAPIKMGEMDAYWGSNVFEELLRSRLPEVGTRLDWLRRYAPAAMTGSGGSVFAWFDDRGEAESVLALCPPEWNGRVAASLACSPLLAQEGA